MLIRLLSHCILKKTMNFMSFITQLKLLSG
nr:MAG TPA: hypothetical protein [Caudoviricetes sp.]